MRIQLHPKPRANALLVCIALGGMIVLLGVTMYILVKACEKIPVPPQGGNTNDVKIVQLQIIDAPKTGSAFTHAALMHWDGTNFTLQILHHENLLSSQPKVFWLTGVVNRATGGAEVKAYDDQGQLLSTNQFEKAQ